MIGHTAGGHWEKGHHFSSTLDPSLGLISILSSGHRRIFHLGKRHILSPASPGLGRDPVPFPWPKQFRVELMNQSRQIIFNSVISSPGLWGRGWVRQDGQLAEGKPVAAGRPSCYYLPKRMTEHSSLLWPPEITWIQPYTQQLGFN